MLGASTIINPIIKIVTTVVILGAVYLFFVKPALDTTRDITDNFNESFSGFGFDSFDDVQEQAEDLGVTISEPGNNAQTKKLFECMGKANENATKVQRCAEKFGP